MLGCTLYRAAARVEAFIKPGDLVLDPFCGSGFTLVAARTAERQFLDIQLDRSHVLTASMRVYSMTSSG
ncbi:DNA methyltransferase [Mesorhizobium sp. INR15]|uniref:DNA methyltransferase n=1 Tax=Mesorhizobium sp. INR15 TaxID=2654248 RepID=UPI00189679AF|nr:DNA methyltransferase [Mesorhizobium sp. INR15]QPC95905.1 hypothetical protein GA829_35870 [Mesorhizobium sp. INR15]